MSSRREKRPHVVQKLCKWYYGRLYSWCSMRFFFAYVIIFFNRCQEEVPGHHTDGLTQQHPTHGHCRRRRQCFSMPLLCLLLYINNNIMWGHHQIEI